MSRQAAPVGLNTTLIQLIQQLVQNNNDLTQAVVQSFQQSNQAQHQAYAALAAAHVPVHASAPSAPAVNPPKLTVAEPDEYDGSCEKFDHFLTSLDFNFLTRPSAFPTDQVKIYYALSYMKKGPAEQWAMSTFQILRENRLAYPDWAAFEAALRGMFEDPNKTQKARLELKEIRQGPYESVDKFFSRFNHLKLLAKLDDEALLNILTHAVREDIYDIVCDNPAMDRTVVAWEAEMKKYDLG